jgi:uncharacterized membrane protein
MVPGVTTASRQQHSAIDWRLVVLLFLAVSGFAVNLLLLVKRLADDGAALAGCGPGSGCEAVLGSQWSQVLGVPVTVPGLLVYVAVVLGLTKPGRWLLAPLLGIICGAAVWFVLVQALIIRAFCPWCMAAHVIGIALTAIALPMILRADGTRRAAAVVGGAAVACVLAVAGLQILGPRPATHRVDEFRGDGAAGLADDAHSRGSGRLAVFLDGSKGFRVAGLPHHGNPDAPHVIIEYFDYACSACRTMAGFLEELVAAHPDEICVVMLPVPLDRQCNHAMPELESGTPGACTMARAALAMWRTDPGQFHAFHHALLADPTAENASMLAAALLADAEAAMADPWIDEILFANIEDWRHLSADNARLPKLLLANRRIIHGVPDSADSLLEAVRAELSLRR